MGGMISFINACAVGDDVQANHKLQPPQQNGEIEDNKARQHLHPQRKAIPYTKYAWAHWKQHVVDVNLHIHI